MPARWHPDEKGDVVSQMVERGTLEPNSFINPSLPLSLTWPVVFVQNALSQRGLLRGCAADPLLAARILSAIAGAASVAVLGFAAGRIQPGLSVLAAFALALAPAHANLCHFATAEPWLFLGVAATLERTLAYIQHRARIEVVGLLLGLTIGIKYTAVALLVGVLIAVFVRDAQPEPRGTRAGYAACGAVLLLCGVLLLTDTGATLAKNLHLQDPRLLQPQHALAFVRRGAMMFVGLGTVLIGVSGLSGSPAARRWIRRDVILLAVGTVLGFVISTPYALLKPMAFLSDVAFNDQTRFEYKGLAGASTSFAAYAQLVVAALTTPAAIAALAGIGIALKRGGRMGAVVVAFAAFPYLLVAASGHQALRFVATMLPAAAMLAAWLLSALPSPRTRRWLSAAVLGREAVTTLLVLRLFLVDSRLLAQRWLERHVPANESIDVITNHLGYAPSPPAGRTFRVVPTLSREMAPPNRFREAAARYPGEAADWVVLTASYYERFIDHPDQMPEQAAFFQNLLDGRAGFTRAARFGQEGWLRPQAEFVDPEIVILQRRTH